MVTYTSTYNLKLPVVGQDDDAWGGYINDNTNALESILTGNTTITSLVITTADINGGTLDNVVIGGTTAAAITGTTITASGNIVVSGTVDGRDIATDGTKLDGIESGATADQTKADIDALNINADQVDGLEASQFLRSDTSDTMTGDLTVSENLKADGGTLIMGDDAYSTSTSYVGMKTSNMSGSTDYMIISGHSDGNTYVSAKSGSDVFINGGGNVSTYGIKVYPDQNPTVGTSNYTIWHSGNDGSGSGLDADTVDGIQASSFLRSDANDTTTGQLTVDNDSGVKVVYGTETTNVYYTGYGIDSQRVTTYFRPTNDNTQTLYVGGSGSANDWNTIAMKVGNDDNVTINGNTVWHAGNDGSGSGLDADTLDGVQGSSYLRSDASDTFTGTLTLTGSMNASGTVYAESLQEDYDALSGTTPTADADNGGAFSLTMTGNTTFTFGSVTSGRSVGFVLQLTGNGSTVTWPASVDWAGGTAPDAPASGETDIYVFWTRDGGTTWYGALAIDAAA